MAATATRGRNSTLHQRLKERLRELSINDLLIATLPERDAVRKFGDKTGFAFRTVAFRDVLYIIRIR